MAVQKLKEILAACADDTPVASAKAGPRDGSEGVDGDRTANGRLWRTVIIGEQEHRIDMQVIRPYLRVITHGGQSSLSIVRYDVKEVRHQLN